MPYVVVVATAVEGADDGGGAVAEAEHREDAEVEDAVYEPGGGEGVAAILSHHYSVDEAEDYVAEPRIRATSDCRRYRR